MQEFLFIILNMPTVLYTVMLAFVLMYWVTVIAGVLDLDLFDIDADIDADVDLDLDADVDLDLDLDADMDADVDVDADADVDVDGPSVGIFVQVLMALGLVGVPLTISMSILVVYNWALTFLMTYFLGGNAEVLSGLISAGVLGASFALSLLMTSLTTRPLRPLFRSKSGARAADALIGKTVRVVSGKVTERFGRGELPLDGSTVNLSIRCEVGSLRRGDEALIIGYDADSHIYSVEPLDAMLDAPRRQRSADELEAAFADLEEAEEELREQQQQEVAEAHQQQT